MRGVLGMMLVGGLVVGIGGLGAGAAETETMAPAPAASPLEGTTWNVKLMPDAAAAEHGEQAFDDALVFEHGKVWMTECVKVGFEASPYTLTPEGAAWKLWTQQSSPKEGTSDWSASIQESAIQGTLTWTKQDGTVLKYTFEGQRKSS